MQTEEAKQLRQFWGDRLCDHPQLDKEYFKTIMTGHYFCVQCGKEFRYEEVDRKQDRESPRRRHTLQ
jgi:hypothetical protein